MRILTENKKLCFFNNGDMKPDNEKFIGNTDGSYFCMRHKIEDVYKTALARFKNGYGVYDLQENNLEAVL
jgi:hypothetical protein